ncbi:MAG: hypothetical protein Q7S00_04265, partial [bacterium]|nr:hypothetical protein [bacterium]
MGASVTFIPKEQFEETLRRRLPDEPRVDDLLAFLHPFETGDGDLAVAGRDGFFVEGDRWGCQISYDQFYEGVARRVLGDGPYREDYLIQVRNALIEAAGLSLFSFRNMPTESVLQGGMEVYDPSSWTVTARSEEGGLQVHSQAGWTSVYRSFVRTAERLLNGELLEGEELHFRFGELEVYAQSVHADNAERVLPEGWNTSLLEDSVEQRQVADRKYPAVAPDGRRPFLLLRTTAAEGEKPMAYAVLYPSPDGLRLRVSERARFDPGEEWSRLLSLAQSIGAPLQQSTDFREPSYRQAYVYLAGHLFRERFIASGSELRAFELTLDELNRMDPEHSYSPSFLEYVLKGIGFRVDFLSAAYRVNEYFKAQEVYIWEQFELIRSESSGPSENFWRLMKRLRQ